MFYHNFALKYFNVSIEWTTSDMALWEPPCWSGLPIKTSGFHFPLKFMIVETSMIWWLM